jgi:D-lyxose ketol-isomerase
MASKEEVEKAKRRAAEILEAAGFALLPEEKQKIEVADFNLNRLEEMGLEIVVYVNTARCCAKELVLFPRQICPEHMHPPVGKEPGKEETFRCRKGEVYLYVPGEPTPSPKARLPKDKEKTFTVWHEIILRPGEQYTLAPNTKHWFQGGDEGAIISEFSTTSRDEADIFADPEIIR